MFELRQTLPKYLRTFLHENSVMIIGLADQSDYSKCHFMVRFFILKVADNLPHFDPLYVGKYTNY